MNCTDPQQPNRFRDARHILMVAQVTPGLPFPAISKDHADFRFTGITHAGDATAAVRAAETALSKALSVTFTSWYPAPAGSAEYGIRVAVLPSGMLVELVALAEHVRPLDAREDERTLQAAAA